MELADVDGEVTVFGRETALTDVEGPGFCGVRTDDLATAVGNVFGVEGCVFGESCVGLLNTTVEGCGVKIVCMFDDVASSF